MTRPNAARLRFALLIAKERSRPCAWARGNADHRGSVSPPRTNRLAGYRKGANAASRQHLLTHNHDAYVATDRPIARRRSRREPALAPRPGSIARGQVPVNEKLEGRRLGLQMDLVHPAEMGQ
jgi:hypothetical protein